MAKKLNNKHNFEGRNKWIERKQYRNFQKGKQVWITTTGGITFYPERIRY